MKAAIYARYSTANQDATSLDGQERVCRAYADARGIEIVEVYTDAAVSGTTLARDGLKRLLADAAKKKFRAVIVPDLSRLSRDRIDSGVLVRQLDDLGVKVLDVETGTDSEDEAADVIHAVKGIVNAEYVKAIRIHTHRQLQTRALAGFNPGGKAYGYTSIEEPSPTDPKNPKRVSVIEPSEAETVRRIFDMSAAGQSPRDIAQQLNAEGVAAPHDGGRGFKQGRGWGHTTIRAMLQSRRYLGEVTWNAFRWKKTARGTRRRIARPASEHVTKTFPELVIVSPELWERVQARFTKRQSGGNTIGRPKGSGVARHMLSGLLKCGVCGGTFSVVHTRKVDGKTQRTLGCAAHKDRGAAICANGQTISERKVMAALVSHLRDRMADPDRLKTFVETFRAKFAELQASNADPVSDLHVRIERQHMTIANVMQALVAVPGSKALADKLAAEEKALADLEAQRAQLQDTKPRILPHPAAIARYVTALAETLEAGDLSQAGDVLRSALAPFLMHPQAVGYRMSGALNLGVSEKVSSGGVI
jgi:site-specific DNA recombinase